MKKNIKVERSVLIDRKLLSNNDYNPNKMSEQEEKAIAESLEEYGQLTALLVRPDPDIEGNYIIIDGEHRGKKLKESLYVDIVHGLTETEAKKLTIVMLKTRGSEDKVELAALLSDINLEIGFDELNLGLPYQDSELQELLELAEFDWANYHSLPENDPLSPGKDPLSPGKDPDEDWVTVSCRVPKETIDVVNQAIALVSEEKELDENRAIANGQVLEILCAEYLAIPDAEDSISQ